MCSVTAENGTLISVVIPCLNVADTLPLQLAALARQGCSFPWEVIIADNGSTDSTIAIAERWRGRLPALKIVSEARRGRHYACNEGARAASGAFLVFVDGDDEIMPGYLKAMGNAFEHSGMAAGRLEHRVLNPTNLRGVGEVGTNGLMEGFGFLPYAPGGAMGIRRNLFEQIGGFAANMDFCEDVDISWRAQLVGASITFVPDAVIAIRQRGSPKMMYRQHRNFGEARALLYRDFARHGMPRRTGSEVLTDWLSLAKSVPFLRHPDVRIRWIRRLGRNVGYLRGSVRYGVFFP